MIDESDIEVDEVAVIDFATGRVQRVGSVESVNVGVGVIVLVLKSSEKVIFKDFDKVLIGKTVTVVGL